MIFRIYIQCDSPLITRSKNSIGVFLHIPSKRFNPDPRKYHLAETQALLDILDDRYGLQSTMLATQFPVSTWHTRLPDPTLADAILDRLVHNAYRIEMQGESQRKLRTESAMSST